MRVAAPAASNIKAQAGGLTMNGLSAIAQMNG